jgi:carbonic anhydrase
MNTRLAFALSSIILFTCWAAAAEPAHWGYGEEDGPPVWAKLSPDYKACETGRAQSPIDLRTREAKAPTDAVDFDYRHSSIKITRNAYVVDALNNGHTIQIDVDEMSELEIGSDRFQLLQYHFHAPSEHALDGRRFPMEIHLVHQSASGEIAVVGLLIKEGAANPAFDRILDHLPAEHGESVHQENVATDPRDLLPEDHHWYRYTGSLTTPPCTEGVRWFVVANPITLSAEQIADFTKLFDGNARPLQERNDRTVVYEEFD